MVKQISKLFLIVSYTVALLLVVLCANHSFFWDTIQLGSLHANYFLDTKFTSLFLPNEMDSGHIPFFGWYIALAWKLFGRTMLVAHLAMLPFVVGIVWQLQRLVSYFVPEKFLGFAVFLVFVDPTLLAQITLVSPDVLLVFFFLLGLNAVLRNKQLLLVIASVFLVLISMRGMMVAGLLGLFDIFNHAKENENSFFNKKIISRISLYIPALLVIVWYNFFHFKNTGWVGFHSDSPWADSFQAVGWKGLVRNIGVYVWRLWDFGRIAVWGLLCLLFWKSDFKTFERKTWQLILVTILFLVLLPIPMIWASGLVGHRYLLPTFLLISVLTVHLLFASKLVQRWKFIAFVAVSLLLITGNLWIYPNKISQGWDATLAHLPYYELRSEMIRTIDQDNISPEDVCSFFPNLAQMDKIDLNQRYDSFQPFGVNCTYVMYSNVFNVSDEQYDDLFDNYEIVRTIDRYGIFIYLMKRK